jgi:Protein of unknown function (DUF1566)
MTKQTPKAAEPKVGDKMPDGTIYAGVSPDTGKAMYAMPQDGSLLMTFNAAAEHVAKLDAYGHHDWRMPTSAELNVLFNNRAAIGGFTLTDSNPTGWCWSASGFEFNKSLMWAQRLSDGFQGARYKDEYSTVRCVR